ncbi:hypothetical protein MXB_4070, partial [Myxobolus squamalis]
MGNTLSNQSTQTINVETYIKDFKMFEFIESIKMNRFLKTFLVKYSKNGSGTPQKVLVKLYGSCNSDINNIKRSVHDIRQLGKVFAEIPSIVTYKDIIVTDRSCMAYRPWIHYNLYDRLSTRPFLAENEKIWIIYQILRSLNHIHKYLAHGDLKLENILLTSWGFVIISDLSFQVKPTYLSEETVTNEFNYFFDTSGRQSCYIAPERLKRVTNSSIFYTNHHGDEVESFKLADTEFFFLSNFDLVPPMDIFSLGCMIFQIFTDGKILFKLTDLLMYWKGELTSLALENIIRQNVKNNCIANMIVNMTSLSPAARMSAREYLQNERLFPEYFNYLYDFALKVANFSHSPEFLIVKIKKEWKILLEFARALPDLCTEAFRLYFMIKKCINNKSKNKFDIYINGIESELESVYETIKKINKSFLTDSSSFVRKFYITNSIVKVNTTLNEILPFNRERRDHLLSHTIDVLNNNPHWSMRVSFYKVLPQLLSILGVSAITHLMPLVWQGLIDSCEWVVCSTLQCLKHILISQHVSTDSKISLIKSTIIFLIHPNPSIRCKCFSFLESCFSGIPFIEYQATIVCIIKQYVGTHSGQILNYFPGSNLLSSIVLRPIPHFVFDILLGEFSSIRFLKCLEQNSGAIMDDRWPPNILCDDFLEIHDDLILTDVDNLESLASTNFDFQHVDFGDLVESNDSILQGECTTISNLVSLSLEDPSENSVSDTLKLEYQEFSNLVKCPLDDFEANLINICKQHNMKYKTFLYAKNYIANYKHTCLDGFKGKNVNNSLTLVSTFKPHADSVTRLCSIENSSHFTTASDDCTVKLWDSNQMDASRFHLKYEPIYVYSQMSGRISSVRNLKISRGNETFHRIACSSSEDSDIQIFDVISGGSEKTRRHPFHRCLVDWTRDGGVVELASNTIHSNPLLMAATLYSSVLGYDIREKACQPSLRLVSPKEGYLTSLECDPFGCWVASGTSA